MPMKSRSQGRSNLMADKQMFYKFKLRFHIFILLLLANLNFLFLVASSLNVLPSVRWALAVPETSVEAEQKTIISSQLAQVPFQNSNCEVVNHHKGLQIGCLNTVTNRKMRIKGNFKLLTYLIIGGCIHNRRPSTVMCLVFIGMESILYHGRRNSWFRVAFRAN